MFIRDRIRVIVDVFNELPLVESSSARHAIAIVKRIRVVEKIM